MKFVIDESVSLSVAKNLRNIGHEVFAIGETETAGLADVSVYELVKKEYAVLITRDRDFTTPILHQIGRTRYWRGFESSLVLTFGDAKNFVHGGSAN